MPTVQRCSWYDQFRRQPKAFLPAHQKKTIHSPARLPCARPFNLEPLLSQPSVEELQACFGLVERNHVTACMDSHECEVSMRLDFANLSSIAVQAEVLHLGRGEFVVVRIFKRLSPCLVAEPVANEVCITSVDKNRDLLNDSRNQSMEGLHPVTLEQDVAIDVEVAGIIA